MFGAPSIAVKGRHSIEFVDRRIERAMRLAQIGWHDVGVVKIGECSVLDARRARRARFAQECLFLLLPSG